ncbi:hypothetical protein GCM10027416_05880 [Okibacterium endophyticum]
MARLPFPANLVYAPFGPRDFALDPYHKGVDFGYGIANQLGTPVPCAAGGYVFDQGHSSGFGYWKEVHHAAGWRTRYHMLGASGGAQKGSQIAEGEIIGLIGAPSGGATGVHLHFELWDPNHYDSIYGQRVDPITNINRLPSPQEDDMYDAAAQAALFAKIDSLRGATPEMRLYRNPSTFEVGIACIATGYYRKLANTDYITLVRAKRMAIDEDPVDLSGGQWSFLHQLLAEARAASTGDTSSIASYVSANTIEAVRANVQDFSDEEIESIRSAASDEAYRRSVA